VGVSPSFGERREVKNVPSVEEGWGDNTQFYKKVESLRLAKGLKKKMESSLGIKWRRQNSPSRANDNGIGGDWAKGRLEKWELF